MKCDINYRTTKEYHEQQFKNASYETNTYMGIDRNFLRTLFAEQWYKVFDSAYGDDIEDFIEDYGVELEEFNENFRDI